MDDLIARVRAEIDEDERLAVAASRLADAWEVASLGDPGEPGEAIAFVGLVPPELVDHMIRHDPARVLRQVAASRKTLELHKYDSHTGSDGHTFRYCQTCGSGEPYEYPTAWPCAQLLLLAEIYEIKP